MMTVGELAGEAQLVLPVSGISLSTESTHLVLPPLCSAPLLPVIREADRLLGLSICCHPFQPCPGGENGNPLQYSCLENPMD